MNTSKLAKNLSNVIYAIGVVIFAALVGIWIFGANKEELLIEFL